MRFRVHQVNQEVHDGDKTEVAHGASQGIIVEVKMVGNQGCIRIKTVTDVAKYFPLFGMISAKSAMCHQRQK